MDCIEVSRGTSPIILGLPHTGTDVPAPIWDRLNDNGRLLADTDWHIETLYDGLIDNVTTVRALFHRYVIDANRDPGGESLYPGQNTTGLIPESDFEGRPIWREGLEPGRGDTAERLETYHAAYHRALTAEIERVRRLHGVVILYDCHSIRSSIPFLFSGRLPHLNIGTNGGKTCAPRLEAVAVEVAGKAEGFSSILNGRFKGGWTTRYYGPPADNVHAIQMELAQATYLRSEATPFAYDADKAAKLRVHLAALLGSLASMAPDLHKS